VDKITKKSISNNSKKKRNFIDFLSDASKINTADTPTSQTSIKARKTRSRNFSEAEKADIMENYAIHKDLLKSKHVSGYKHTVTNQMKDEAWRRITDSVNAIGRAMRTVDEVKGNKTRAIAVSDSYPHHCAL